MPYKSGAESITAVLGGQVDATSEASIVVLPYLRAASSRRWRFLDERISAYPQLATAIEQGFPEFDRPLGRRACTGGTPSDHRQDGGRGRRGDEGSGHRQRLKEMGIEPIGGTPASFDKFIDEERARLGGVVKATGMTED